MIPLLKMVCLSTVFYIKNKPMDLYKPVPGIQIVESNENQHATESYCKPLLPSLLALVFAHICLYLGGGGGEGGREDRVGAMVRALVSYQCGPGSVPGLGIICARLSLLLVLILTLRGFTLGTPVFPSPKNPTLLNNIIAT